MTKQIDSTYGMKPLQSQLLDEAVKRQLSDKKKGPEDRVSLGSSDQVGATYGPNSTLEVGSPYELLRNLVVKTLQEQNVPLQVSTGSGDVDLTNLSVEDAQKLVSEDGYFGVKKTSERIVDFAIKTFGNDPSRLDEMKSAIDKGFKDAQDAFGGKLPEISQQTYDAIMQKLDDFAQQSKKSGE